MAKFIISTDSCADLFKSYLNDNNIYYIIVKRIVDGVVKEDMFDSAEEYEAFYESIRNGELPTTAQINPFEFNEYFTKILKENPEGDIIHISLSSGFSNTYSNSLVSANEINEKLNGRKIYTIDSLGASCSMGMLVDRLIELRNAGVNAEEAIRTIEDLRDHQQSFVIIGNLFHLKRGGRISGFKATIGSLLNIKPIIIFSDKGKLAIENSVKGLKKSVAYILKKFKELSKNGEINYNKPLYILHSSAHEEYKFLKEEIEEQFVGIKIKENIIGPIIGTHVGSSTIGILFEGEKRLAIK